MNRTQILEQLREWFDSHRIAYKEAADEAYPKSVKIVTVAEKICKIAVCICEPDEEDDTFRTLRAMNYHPFFIREGDTWDYTHGKIRNCTRGWNIAKVKKMERLAEKEARKKAREAEAAARKPKRKRVRIHRPVYEKVEPIKH